MTRIGPVSRAPYQNNEAFMATKTITFDGTLGKGLIGSDTIFTVTGDVLITIFAVCSNTLAGATATIACGISGNTTAYMTNTVATTITTGLTWKDGTPATNETLPTQFILSRSVLQTVATANVTGGTLSYYALWRPLSAGASVVAA